MVRDGDYWVACDFISLLGMGVLFARILICFSCVGVLRSV